MRATKISATVWSVIDGHLRWTVVCRPGNVEIINSRNRNIDPYGKRGQEVMRAVAAPVRA